MAPGSTQGRAQPFLTVKDASIYLSSLPSLLLILIYAKNFDQKYQHNGGFSLLGVTLRYMWQPALQSQQGTGVFTNDSSQNNSDINMTLVYTSLVQILKMCKYRLLW